MLELVVTLLYSVTVIYVVVDMFIYDVPALLFICS